MVTAIMICVGMLGNSMTSMAEEWPAAPKCDWCGHDMIGCCTYTEHISKTVTQKLFRIEVVYQYDYDLTTYNYHCPIDGGTKCRKVRSNENWQKIN